MKKLRHCHGHPMYTGQSQ